MTKTAWANLPNARYIDLILADLKANTDNWDADRDAAWDAAWDEARSAVRNADRDAAWVESWDASWDAARNVARDAVRTAAQVLSRDAAWDAARDAILCLIAYDDCAYLLDEKPEYVQPLAASGQTQAILLYPACLALSKVKA